MRRVNDRLAIYERYVQVFEDTAHNHSGKKQTQRGWTPYRFCSEDWLLAVTVARSSRERYDMGLFVSEDHALFERDSGLMAALSFHLADALRRTGKMELRFFGKEDLADCTLESGFEPSIPAAIRRFAKEHGIELRSRRHISDSEGRKLYLALARFSESLRTALDERQLPSVEAAFLAHRGVWSPTALEVLARYSSNPEAVLTGRLVPEQWIEFKRELLLLRLALTAERVLTLFELDQDDALRPLKVEVLNPIELRITCSDEISLACEYGQRFKALPGVPIVVRLCPYEQHGYERVWSELDWSNDDNHPILLACTKDLDWAGPVCWLGLSSKAESRLSVLKLIDTLDELDGEILVRLKRAATTRVGLEGRGE